VLMHYATAARQINGYVKDDLLSNEFQLIDYLLIKPMRTTRMEMDWFNIRFDFYKNRITTRRIVESKKNRMITHSRST
jgi:hypothetical protein